MERKDFPKNGKNFHSLPALNKSLVLVNRPFWHKPCIPSPLQHANNLILQSSNIATRQYCNILILQHFNTTILQYPNIRLLTYHNILLSQSVNNLTLEYCNNLITASLPMYASRKPLGMYADGEQARWLCMASRSPLRREKGGKDEQKSQK